jgi:hypothetical protein
MKPIVSVEVVEVGAIVLFVFIVAFWGRVVLSEEQRMANTYRFKKWIQSDRVSAKVARGVWWFGIICSVLHVILTSMRFFGEQR